MLIVHAAEIRVGSLRRHEHGKFFSIDLGGTNLRVMYLKLPRDRAIVVRALTPNIRTDSAEPASS